MTRDQIFIFKSDYNFKFSTVITIAIENRSGKIGDRFSFSDQIPIFPVKSICDFHRKIESRIFSNINFRARTCHRTERHTGKAFGNGTSAQSPSIVGDSHGLPGHGSLFNRLFDQPLGACQCPAPLLDIHKNNLNLVLLIIGNPGQAVKYDVIHR